MKQAMIYRPFSFVDDYHLVITKSELEVDKLGSIGFSPISDSELAALQAAADEQFNSGAFVMRKLFTSLEEYLFFYPHSLS